MLQYLLQVSAYKYAAQLKQLAKHQLTKILVGSRHHSRTTES